MKIQEAIEQLQKLPFTEVATSYIRRESKDYFIYLTMIVDDDGNLKPTIQSDDSKPKNDCYSYVPFSLDDLLADDYIIVNELESAKGKA